VSTNRRVCVGCHCNRQHCVHKEETFQCARTHLSRKLILLWSAASRAQRHGRCVNASKSAVLHRDRRLIISLFNGTVWTTEITQHRIRWTDKIVWDVTPYNLVDMQQYLAGDKDTSSSFVRIFFQDYIPTKLHGVTPTKPVVSAFHVISTNLWKWLDVNLIYHAVRIASFIQCLIYLHRIISREPKPTWEDVGLSTSRY
jgi:hypothetical protein